MNPDLLTIRAAPPAPPPAPWVIAFVTYADGPIVAVLWWDNQPLSDRGARLVDDDGVITDGVIGADDAVAEPGWFCWLVGDEVPWAYDPRVTVASVEALGPATPTVAEQGLLAILAEAGEPTIGYARSVEAVRRMLPWCPADDDVAEIIEQTPGIGSGTVVDETEVTDR